MTTLMRFFFRHLFCLAFIFMIGVLTTSTVQAQDAGGEEKGDWVLCYALVVLAISLGILVVCRPSKRSLPKEDE